MSILDMIYGPKLNSSRENMRAIRRGCSESRNSVFWHLNCVQNGRDVFQGQDIYGGYD